MSQLDGRVAFITGASRGIGAAVARGLSREGVELGLASRSGDDPERLCIAPRSSETALRPVTEASWG
jgi:NAD(P)-dependent dehydrogenase (short-subunit alcohol dehydrogenase family)